MSSVNAGPRPAGGGGSTGGRRQRAALAPLSVPPPAAAPGAPAGPTGWADLDPADGFRPVDHRWRLAWAAFAGAPVPAPWLDEWVAVGRALRSGVPAAPDDRLRAGAGALEIFERRSRRGRFEVEARLLSGEAPERVDAKAGLAPGTAEAYERLFFDVTDRLQYRSVIVHLAVRLHEAAPNDPVPHALMMAYRGGPLIADAVVDALRDPCRADAPSGDAARTRAQVLRALGTATTPVTPRNAAAWTRLGLLYRERDLRVGPRR